MEVIINDRRVKYEDGEIWSYYKWGTSKKWFLLKGSIDKETGYKRVNINNKKYKYHRVIYKLYNPYWNINDYSKNNCIDHKDRNRLNNNIDNLRVVTNQENCFNRTCKGYSWHKASNKWNVRIMIDGETKSFYFKTEEEAIKKRAELKKEYHIIN